MRFTEVSLLLMAIFSSVIAIEERSNRARSINSRGRAIYVDYRNRISTSSYERGTADTFPTRGTLLRGNIRSSSSEIVRNEAPQPYNFNYQSADEQGNSHYHRAEADSSGTVRGSYGYTDIQGLYRVVDYTADANGYRASIRSNEPGTDGKENPADVQMIVELPPFGIQNRYTPLSGTGRGDTASGFSNAALGTFKSGIKSNVTEESDEYR